jgi:hypothetical protein
MSLTNTAIRNAGIRGKPYKLADEKGLFLLVNPAGGKWWGTVPSLVETGVAVSVTILFDFANEFCVLHIASNLRDAERILFRGTSLPNFFSPGCARSHANASGDI